MLPFKLCKSCNNILDINNFYKLFSYDTQKYYYASSCKSCVNAKRVINLNKQRLTDPNYRTKANLYGKRYRDKQKKLNDSS